MKIIDHIAGLVSGKIDMMKSVMSIVKLETKLAALSIFPLIMNVCLLIVVLLSLWFSSMTLLGYTLIYIFKNIFLALGLLVILNLFFLIILHHGLMVNLRQMSFEKTREYFSKKEEDEHDRIETTDKHSAGKSHETIKISTD